MCLVKPRYSPASGWGVIHGVLVGLRRRLCSPRAARHRRSRGDAVYLTAPASSHSLLSTQLDHTDTSCISTWSTTLHFHSYLRVIVRSLQHPTHQITPRYHYINAKNPLKNGNLWQERTDRTRDSTIKYCNIYKLSRFNYRPDVTINV